RAAGVVLAITVVALLVSMAQISQALQEKERQEQIALAEKKVAEQAADEARAITDFLVRDMLAANDPHSALGGRVTVLGVLARAEKKIDETLKDKGLVEAAVRHTIGGVYHVLGEDKPAERHLVRACELRTKLLGRANRQTLESMFYLTVVLEARGKLKEAHALCLETLDLQTRLLGEDHGDTVRTMQELGNVLNAMGKWWEVRQLREQVVEQQRRLHRDDGDNHPDVLMALHNLAHTLGAGG